MLPAKIKDGIQPYITIQVTVKLDQWNGRVYQGWFPVCAN
jgi:hypothetical protein